MTNLSFSALFSNYRKHPIKTDHGTLREVEPKPTTSIYNVNLVRATV